MSQVVEKKMTAIFSSICHTISKDTWYSSKKSRVLFKRTLKQCSKNKCLKVHAFPIYFCWISGSFWMHLGINILYVYVIHKSIHV